jgi:hypothetical protein
MTPHRARRHRGVDVLTTAEARAVGEPSPERCAEARCRVAFLYRRLYE